MRHLAITGMDTAAMISRIFLGEAMRATPPSARICAGTRSSAITATAPAFSAITACSALVTSMMTPPFSISASPVFKRRLVELPLVCDISPLLWVLDPLQFALSQLVLYVSGIQRGSRLKEQDPSLFLSHGPVLDTSQYHDELALLQPHMPVTELDAEAPFDHQEHLVFGLMMMPDELPFQLDELHQLAVELGSDVGLPVLPDLGEFLGNVYLFHFLLRNVLPTCIPQQNFPKETLFLYWTSQKVHLRYSVHTNLPCPS